jgi:fucose 4-O-acetylase-like acetyltransferase
MNSQKGTIRSFFAKAFHLSILQQNRLAWVDYLRGIAIVLIVYRHVLIGIQRGQIEMPELLVNANMIFYSFRMPLFFILSGLFISKTLERKSVKQVIENKFNLLLYPYLIWAFLQISLQIALSHVTNSTRTVQDYLYIFYQPRGLDQFWYLPALFNTTVIYVLLKSKLKLPAGGQLILGLIFYFSARYFQKVSMISDWMDFYFFFALGDAIRQPFFKAKVQDFLRNPVALLLIIPAFIAVQRYYLTHNLDILAQNNKGVVLPVDFMVRLRDQIDFLFIALVGCLSMMILSFRLEQLKILKFLRILGFHSLPIYVMHVIISAFMRLSLIVVFGITNPLVLLLCSMTAGIIIPVVLYNLFMRDGGAWFLFSYRAPQQLKKKSFKARAASTAAFRR